MEHGAWSMALGAWGMGGGVMPIADWQGAAKETGDGRPNTEMADENQDDSVFLPDQLPYLAFHHFPFAKLFLLT
jgi:hypothetical protein